MTGERSNEETRLSDEELDDAITMGDESWFWPVGGEKASVEDVLRDLRAVRVERDALAAENEALREALNLLRDGDYDVGDAILSGLHAEERAVALQTAIEAACDELEAVHPSKSQSFHDGVDHAVHFIRAAAAVGAVPETRDEHCSKVRRTPCRDGSHIDHPESCFREAGHLGECAWQDEPATPTPSGPVPDNPEKP